MSKIATRWDGINFGNSEAGTSNGLFNAKTEGYSASEGGFAGTNITNKLNDGSLIMRGVFEILS